MNIIIIKNTIGKEDLERFAEETFGDMVKAVVDIQKGIMAVGGELHSDEEEILLQQGSSQDDLWGMNIYPARSPEEWIEFDAMINIRPRQGNRSRTIQDRDIREKIKAIVHSLIS